MVRILCTLQSVTAIEAVSCSFKWAVSSLLSRRASSEGLVHLEPGSPSQSKTPQAAGELRPAPQEEQCPQGLTNRLSEAPPTVQGTSGRQPGQSSHEHAHCKLATLIDKGKVVLSQVRESMFSDTAPGHLL